MNKNKFKDLIKFDARINIYIHKCRPKKMLEAYNLNNSNRTTLKEKM